MKHEKKKNGAESKQTVLPRSYYFERDARNYIILVFSDSDRFDACTCYIRIQQLYSYTRAGATYNIQRLLANRLFYSVSKGQVCTYRYIICAAKRCNVHLCNPLSNLKFSRTFQTPDLFPSTCHVVPISTVIKNPLKRRTSAGYTHVEYIQKTLEANNDDINFRQGRLRKKRVFLFVQHHSLKHAHTHVYDIQSTHEPLFSRLSPFFCFATSTIQSDDTHSRSHT